MVSCSPYGGPSSYGRTILAARAMRFRQRHLEIGVEKRRRKAPWSIPIRIVRAKIAPGAVGDEQGGPCDLPPHANLTVSEIPRFRNMTRRQGVNLVDVRHIRSRRHVRDEEGDDAPVRLVVALPRLFRRAVLRPVDGHIRESKGQESGFTVASDVVSSDATVKPFGV